MTHETLRLESQALIQLCTSSHARWYSRSLSSKKYCVHFKNRSDAIIKFMNENFTCCSPWQRFTFFSLVGRFCLLKEHEKLNLQGFYFYFSRERERFLHWFQLILHALHVALNFARTWSPCNDSLIHERRGRMKNKKLFKILLLSKSLQCVTNLSLLKWHWKFVRRKIRNIVMTWNDHRQNKRGGNKCGQK